MKKILSILLVLSLLFGCTIAMAEDLGVQVIGGNNGVVETLSLDDMKLGESYKISGYATVKPLDFYYVDYFAQYQSGKNGELSIKGSNGNDDHVYVEPDQGNYSNENYAIYASWKDSGETAEFALLHMDLVNLGKAEIGFMAEATVKVVYDDEYEFGGWVRQINYDYFKRVYSVGGGSVHSGHAADGGDPLYESDLFLDPGAEEKVATMYTGHYVFGCTLPNEVVTTKESLKIIITLGDNELTYNIRK